MRYSVCVFFLSGILLSALFEPRLGYLFGGGAILASVIYLLVSRFAGLSIRRSSVWLFFLPFFIFLSWCYGVIWGAYSGNDSVYVFSNFAGLSLYLLFYFFWAFSYGLKDFYWLLFWCAIICSFWGLLNWFIMSGAPGGEGFSGGRVYISATLLYGVPFFSVYLFSRFFSGGKFGLLYLESTKVGFFFVTFFLAALILPARSKGFLLAVVLLAFVCLAYLLLHLAVFAKFKLAALLPFFAAAGGAVVLLVYFDYFYRSFAADNVSNKIRSEQFDYLWAELSFLGAGLGAVLKSGYSRDDTGYGFELTYLNIVHKLGVFSFPLFLSYIGTIVLALKFILAPGARIFGGFMLGLVSFLVPGAGNPILLSPAMVLLHSAALYYAYVYSGRKI